MTDSAGTSRKDYDELGRLGREERILDGVVYTKLYEYNEAGLPASTQYPDGQVISWTYDAAGNLMSETGTIAEILYDAAGRMTQQTYLNGAVTTKTYSPSRGWLEGIQTEKEGTVHQALAYGYFDDGMIQSVVSAKSMETWQYSYDELNRLTEAVNLDTPGLNQSFQYDHIGNIRYNSAFDTDSSGNVNYHYEGAQPHAVTAIGPNPQNPLRTYEYDLAGRMKKRELTNITWNGDGKPSSVGNVGFTYDGIGNRLKKVSGGETTLYPFPDYEIANDGTVTKYLAGGKQVDAEFFAFHQDHLDSIQSITDADGEVKSKKYTPFGDTHTNIGMHTELRGWIGEREEETELVYLNARYYDPEIGRFVSPDPFAQIGQGLNRYTYSSNNPVNFLDPSGLFQSEDDLTGDASHSSYKNMGIGIAFDLFTLWRDIQYILGLGRGISSGGAMLPTSGRSPEHCFVARESAIGEIDRCQGCDTVEDPIDSIDPIDYPTQDPNLCLDGSPLPCGGGGGGGDGPGGIIDPGIIRSYPSYPAINFYQLPYSLRIPQTHVLGPAASRTAARRDSLMISTGIATGWSVKGYERTILDEMSRTTRLRELRRLNGNLGFTRGLGNSLIIISATVGTATSFSYYHTGDTYNAGRVICTTCGSILGGSIVGLFSIPSGPGAVVAGAGGSVLFGWGFGRAYDWWYGQ